MEPHKSHDETNNCSIREPVVGLSGLRLNTSRSFDSERDESNVITVPPPPTVLTPSPRMSTPTLYSPAQASRATPSSSLSSSSTSKCLSRQQSNHKFLMMVHDMLNDLSKRSSDAPCCWSDKGDVIVIMDRVKFENEILFRYLSIQRVESFVRKLKRFGFRKIEPGLDVLVQNGRTVFIPNDDARSCDLSTDDSSKSDQNTTRNTLRLWHQHFHRDRPNDISKIKLIDAAKSPTSPSSSSSKRIDSPGAPRASVKKPKSPTTGAPKLPPWNEDLFEGTTKTIDDTRKTSQHARAKPASNDDWEILKRERSDLQRRMSELDGKMKQMKQQLARAQSDYTEIEALARSEARTRSFSLPSHSTYPSPRELHCRENPPCGLGTCEYSNSEKSFFCRDETYLDQRTGYFELSHHPPSSIFRENYKGTSFHPAMEYAEPQQLMEQNTPSAPQFLRQTDRSLTLDVLGTPVESGFEDVFDHEELLPEVVTQDERQFPAAEARQGGRPMHMVCPPPSPPPPPPVAKEPFSTFGGTSGNDTTSQSNFDFDRKPRSRNDGGNF